MRAAAAEPQDELDDAPPLAGIRVLDASSFIAAPAAAMVLGDWGAEVIKIEPPGAGDPHRNSYRNAGYPRSELNAPWQLDGRNKRSIALDLKHAQGRAVLDRLIEHADVMLVNFPRRVRERLRLRWADVRPINPQLIYASLTGYGESGPEADTPGFDATAYFARSGILDAARYEGQPPAISLPAQGDRATAMTLVAGVMIGLYRRQRTGKGGWVGTSLFANGVWSTATLAALALCGAIATPRPPRDRPRSALGNQYRAGDGRWFTLAIPREDRYWAGFCRALGRDELIADPRFAELTPRRANATALAAELDRSFATRDWAYWREKFIALGIAAAPINRIAELAADEQASHAGIFVPTDDPAIPSSIASPLRLGFARPRAAGAAPTLGQHTAEILGEIGYDAASIAALRRDGAVG